jgi:hypothetical protein
LMIDVVQARNGQVSDSWQSVFPPTN